VAVYDTMHYEDVTSNS